MQPWQLLLIGIAGWMNRKQQQVIEYLLEEILPSSQPRSGTASLRVRSTRDTNSSAHRLCPSKLQACNLVFWSVVDGLVDTANGTNKSANAKTNQAEVVLFGIHVPWQ